MQRAATRVREASLALRRVEVLAPVDGYVARRKAYVQASLVDRKALAEAQDANDVMAAHRTLKAGFLTDVSPILAEARMRQGGAYDPIAAYRSSGYRDRVAKERPEVKGSSSGIV